MFSSVLASSARSVPGRYTGRPRQSGNHRCHRLYRGRARGRAPLLAGVRCARWGRPAGAAQRCRQAGSRDVADRWSGRLPCSGLWRPAQRRRSTSARSGITPRAAALHARPAALGCGCQGLCSCQELVVQGAGLGGCFVHRHAAHPVVQVLLGTGLQQYVAQKFGIHAAGTVLRVCWLRRR